MVNVPLAPGLLPTVKNCPIETVPLLMVNAPAPL
jgi:hypothetical protein